MLSKQSGFSLVEIAILFILLATIGLGGYLVWGGQHKSSAKNAGKTSGKPLIDSKSDSLGSTSAGQQTKVKDLESSEPVLKYEKLSFKYPASWKVKNIYSPNDGTDDNYAQRPGRDTVTLTSPSNLLVTIRSGVWGFGYTLGELLSKDPITTMGASYNLNFGNGSADDTAKKTTPSGCVMSESSGFPYSKNIIARTSGRNIDEKTFNVVCITYPETDPVTQKTVAEFKSDPSYQEAIGIIESLTY